MSTSSLSTSSHSSTQNTSSSSTRFISPPQCGKTSLIRHLIHDTSQQHSDIPSVLAPSTLDIPINTESNVRIELRDTESFHDTGMLRDIMKDSDDLVVLVLERSMLHERQRRVICDVLSVLKEMSCEMMIVSMPSVKHDVEENEFRDPEVLCPELADFVYYRGCYMFHVWQDLDAEMLSFVYRLVNVFMHPVRPLVEQDGAIRSAFDACLRRMYWRMQGDDKRGYMDAKQVEKLSNFLEECIDDSLPDATRIESYKVKKRIMKHVDHESGLSEDGFRRFILSLIRAHETPLVWILLLDADYNIDLRLEDSMLYNVIPDTVDHESFISVSLKGEELLKKAFKFFDVDNDGLLSLDADMDQVIEFMEQTPFPKSLLGVCRLIERKDTHEWMLPLDGWISLWYLVAMEKPMLLLQALQAWGFSFADMYDMETDESVFEVVPKPMYRNYQDTSQVRDVDEQKVFMVYLFGASRSGKSAFRSCLAGKRFDPNFDMEYPLSVFNHNYDGKECHVILRECDSDILDDEDSMSLCDAAVMIFDGSDRYSFSVLPSIHRRLSKSIPAVYVQTHAESQDVQQEYEESPQAFWEALGLPSTPTYFSATHHSEEEFQEIRESILCLCHEPDLGQIDVEYSDDQDELASQSSEEMDEHALQRRESRKVVSRVLGVSIGALSVAAVGVLAYRYIVQPRLHSSSRK